MNNTTVEQRQEKAFTRCVSLIKQKVNESNHNLIQTYDYIHVRFNKLYGPNGLKTINRKWVRLYTKPRSICGMGLGTIVKEKAVTKK